MQISTPSSSWSSKTFKWIWRGRRQVNSFFFDIYGMCSC